MNSEELPAGFKQCKGCKQVKPYDDFGKEIKGKFGLKSKCRSCISDKNKSYAQGDGAAVKKKNNEEYWNEHRDEILERINENNARRKYGDNYEQYKQSLATMKKLEKNK